VQREEQRPQLFANHENVAEFAEELLQTMNFMENPQNFIVNPMNPMITPPHLIRNPQSTRPIKSAIKKRRPC